MHSRVHCVDTDVDVVHDSRNYWSFNPFSIQLTSLERYQLQHRASRPFSLSCWNSLIMTFDQAITSSTAKSFRSTSYARNNILEIWRDLRRIDLKYWYDLKSHCLSFFHVIRCVRMRILFSTVSWTLYTAFASVTVAFPCNERIMSSSSKSIRATHDDWRSDCVKLKIP